MKKILLFSLFACLCMNVSHAVCLGTTCAQYPDGGDVEQQSCLKDANATDFTEKWKQEDTACSARQAKIGRCWKQTNKAGEDVMSCAAKICNEDSALWLHKNSDGSYSSWGACYKKDWLQKKYCDKGDERCNDCDGKCELNIIEWQNGSFGKTNAFYNDKLCVCVPKNNADEFCKYTFDADIECADGTTLVYNKELSIPKNLFEGGKCKDESYPTFEEWFDAQFKDVKKYVLEKCPNAKTKTSVSTISGGSGVNNAQLQSAKDSIDSFFASTESHRSGLKTADGKFNTVRLASDLTAGVVLGTVGGVVSGVVIKKKQVEKGFEALHCAVGGQTVADWGDTFEVGLRK